MREAKDVDRQAERPARVHRQGAGLDTATDIAGAAHRRQGPAGGAPRRPEAASRSATRCSRSARPYGLEQTATQGIVSAKGRSLPGDAVVPFIQTDAAVNPGNSGGPLFDGSGSVVGINAQIYSRSGGFQGVSFAIPIDVALEGEGPDRRHRQGRSTAALGVTVQDLNQSLADSFGLKRLDGALGLERRAGQRGGRRRA